MTDHLSLINISCSPVETQTHSLQPVVNFVKIKSGWIKGLSQPVGRFFVLIMPGILQGFEQIIVA